MNLSMLTHHETRTPLTVAAGTVIPFPSTQLAHTPRILMVAFTSLDGRSWDAIGGGGTLAEAIAYARNSCPGDGTWQPTSWTDLYGD